MSEVTGRLRFFGEALRPWMVICDQMQRARRGWRHAWYFDRRIDAVAFARRKGIRLETE